MIHFIIGTRAQLIKTAPIMVKCRQKGIRYNFIFIAQHKQTIAEIIQKFGLDPPHHVLGDTGTEISRIKDMPYWCYKVMWEGLRRRREIFPHTGRGVAVVHGDALPVLMGAILAKVAGLQVAHVEAGLRSFNFSHPFPEELIRVMTWELGLIDFYFCPNSWALRNVAQYHGKKFNTTYNTLLDSLRIAAAQDIQLGSESTTPNTRYAVVSVHRFETIAARDKLESLVTILESVASKIRLIFILHPSTEQSLRKFQLIDRVRKNPAIEIRKRTGYLPFIALLRKSEFLISDGGSNQEECFYLGHPCLLLRNATERLEGLGNNVVLSRFDLDTIIDFVSNYSKYTFSSIESDVSPSSIILETLMQHGY